MPIDILLESSPKGHFFYKPKGRLNLLDWFYKG